MRNRIDKIDKIIKAENLLREGVDPRKIFSELHGVPTKDSSNLDYFTVDLFTNYTIQQRYQSDKRIRNKFMVIT